METPRINVIQEAEKPPTTRADMVVSLKMAIKEATKSTVLGRQIWAEIDYMLETFPDIKTKGYRKETIFELEPSFNDVKKQFMDEVEMVVPELIHMYISHIERKRKELWLKRLKQHRIKVEEYLVESVDWKFYKKHEGYVEK